jgi:hypothetical protein
VSLPLLIFLSLASAIAAAQQDVIDRCKQTSSKDDRIACLEAALLRRISLQTQPERQSKINVPSLELDAGPAADPVGGKPATAPVEVKPAAAVESEPTGIGADQVIARQQTAEERREELEVERGLAVASYGYVPYRRLVVTLENGQVWRQIKGDNQYFRIDLGRNQTADITEASMGGYTLRLNEIRRTIRVERVK